MSNPGQLVAEIYINNFYLGTVNIKYQAILIS